MALLLFSALPGGSWPTAAAGPQKSVAGDAHGDAHAAADAERRQAFLGAAPLHLEEERAEDAGARGADRVPDGDGATIDVDDIGVPAEVLVDRAGLGGK